MMILSNLHFILLFFFETSQLKSQNTTQDYKDKLRNITEIFIGESITGVLENTTQFENSSDTQYLEDKDLDRKIKRMLLMHGYYKLQKNIVENNITRKKYFRRVHFRQDTGTGDGPPAEWLQDAINAGGTGGAMPVQRPAPPKDAAAGQANRFTYAVSTTATRRMKTRPVRLTFHDACSNLLYYCKAAYQTGRICGRSLYYVYQDFESYCQMDYVNCREKYEVWVPIHMGKCYPHPEYSKKGTFPFYNYKDDSFLDEYILPAEDYSYQDEI